MLAAKTPEVAAEIFRRLAERSTSPAGYCVLGKQTVTQQTRGDVRYYAASNDAFPKMPATAFEVWLPALPAPASRPNGPPGTP